MIRLVHHRRRLIIRGLGSLSFSTALLGGLLGILLGGAAFAQGRTETLQGETNPGSASGANADEVVLDTIPKPDLEAIEPTVRDIIISHQGEVDDAVDQGDPNRLAAALTELCFLYHGHELWSAALPCYRNLERIQPNEPRWPYARGLALLDSGDPEAATEAYEQSLYLLPNNLTVLVGAADLYLAQNQPATARALLRHALNVSPESPAALAGLGQVALSQERYAHAVDYLRRALTQRGDATRLHYPLALAYRGLGDTEKAKEHLAQRGEVGIRPSDPVSDAIAQRRVGVRVLILEGRRAFGSGRFEEARELFAKAVEADATDISARVNLASAQAMEGDVESALETYEQVFAIAPENAAAHFNLGVLLAARGQAVEALPHLEQAVASDPKDAEARRHLAILLVNEGRLVDALPLLEEAVKLRPDNQGSQVALARLYLATDRGVEALRQLEDIVRQMPTQGVLVHALARVLATHPDADLRDGERALGFATQVARASGDADHRITLAAALAETGRCEDAASTIDSVLANLPDDAPQRATLDRMLTAYRAGPPCRPEPILP